MITAILCIGCAVLGAAYATGLRCERDYEPWVRELRRGVMSQASDEELALFERELTDAVLQ